jgi:predicted acylesterase/phospholipase RssA
MDLAEWRRTVQTGVRALSHGSKSFWSNARASSPAALWEELARVYDSMPAGLFSLDGYERFLEDNFARRGVPNHFRAMPKPLRIIAHELDSGEPVVFGGVAQEHVPITRACIASMATPPLFSPVRIGNLHYLNPAPSQLCHVDVALELGARIVVVLNPMVPLRLPPAAPSDDTTASAGGRASVRDWGAMWVANQANRIKLQALLHSCIDRVRSQGLATIVMIEPSSTDGSMFMPNPANFAARRAILEYSYLFTRERVTEWVRDNTLPLEEAGWKPIANGN